MTMSSIDARGIVAVIPARHASSRFPGKPLVSIAGVPLVLRVYARVAAVLPASHIIVATEDERIRDTCEAAGVQVVMTSADCLTGTDRVWEATCATAAEIVINVQGDEPLVAPADILAVIAAKRTTPDVVVNAMCAITDPGEIDSPNVPKVVATAEGWLAYISRAPIPFARGADAPVTYRRQVCIYGFHRSELEAFACVGCQSPLEAVEDIEILRFLDLGVPVRMVEVSGASIAVDVPGDVARVEAELARRGER